MTTLYALLRESHERQRSYCRTLSSAQAGPDTLASAFAGLADELHAHAAAEERFLYAPMLMLDGGLRVGRHAMAEHHEAESLVEELRSLDPGSDDYRERARELASKVRHHLTEEEHGFFQLSGKLLTDRQKTELATAYAADYARLMAQGAST